MADNISISGSGKITGGKYGKISVSGSAKITGAVSCDEMRVSGACKTEGALDAGAVRVSGSLKCDSDLTSKETHVSGAANVNGNVRCDILKSDGSLTVSGDIAAQECIVNGHIKVDGSINAEIFKAKVAVGTVGALYGETVEIENARHYGGRLFDMDFSFGIGKLRINADGKGLTVNEIEATNISLSGVKASRVSGDRVTIDSECEIDTLEYVIELNIPRNAKVKRIIKI